MLVSHLVVHETPPPADQVVLGIGLLFDLFDQLFGFPVLAGQDQANDQRVGAHGGRIEAGGSSPVTQTFFVPVEQVQEKRHVVVLDGRKRIEINGFLLEAQAGLEVTDGRHEISIQVDDIGVPRRQLIGLFKEPQNSFQITLDIVSGQRDIGLRIIWVKLKCTVG